MNPHLLRCFVNRNDVFKVGTWGEYSWVFFGSLHESHGNGKRFGNLVWVCIKIDNSKTLLFLVFVMIVNIRRNCVLPSE